MELYLAGGRIGWVIRGLSNTGFMLGKGRWGGGTGICWNVFRPDCVGQYLSPQRPPGFGGDELPSSTKRQAFLVTLPSPEPCL